jgi:serine/threonine-protein kinase
VLYELLLGRRPFAADSITTLVYQILHHDPLAEPADLGRLGEPLAGLLRDCLAKAPGDRIADGRALAARIRGLGTSEPPTSALPPPVAGHHELAPTPVAEPEPVAALPAASFRPLWRWIAGVAGVLVAAAAVVAVVSRSRVPAPAERPPEVHSSGLDEAAATPAAEASPPRVIAVPPATPSERPAASPTRAPARPTAAPVAPPATRAPRATPPISAMYYTRGEVEFHVDPETAVIVIDGDEIGTSDEWDGAGGGGVWRFADRRGVHYVEIRAPGHATAWVRITVTPVADEDPLEVEVDLEPGP